LAISIPEAKCSLAIAEAAKEACLVSRLLQTSITLEARLDETTDGATAAGVQRSAAAATSSG
jgi:hypothetical protein